MTRANGPAVDHHGTGPAESLAAAVLAAGQIQLVPQDAQQIAVRLGRDLMRDTVDPQRDHAAHGSILDGEIRDAAISVIRGQRNGVNGRMGGEWRVASGGIDKDVAVANRESIREVCRSAL
jgi:hypothetical protein